MSDAYVALTLAIAAMLCARVFDVFDGRSSVASYLLPALAIITVSVALGPAHSREVSAGFVCEYGVTARDCDDLLTSTAAAPMLDVQELFRVGSRQNTKFENGN